MFENLITPVIATFCLSSSERTKVAFVQLGQVFWQC